MEDKIDTKQKRGWWRLLRLRNLFLGLALGIVGLVIYSIYIGYFYEPDPQDTVLIGQKVMWADSPGSVRVVVKNHVTGRPVQSASVQLALEGETGRTELGQFKTDQHGTISGNVHIPSIPVGKYMLAVNTKSRVGRDKIVREIEVQRPVCLYITTDKPMYQPGQTVHMRAMALNRNTLKPFGGENVSFEVEDPKGNKVSRVGRTTSNYGIASADFEIANEVILGRYRIRAVAGGVESEKIVTVKHYVLPKFKIELTTAKPFYLPAEVMRGKLNAEYFFGKPVANGEVELVGRTIVEKPIDIFKIQGRTDKAGHFSFETSLPDYFTGVPLKGGDAFLEIKATVLDSAGHTEKASQMLTVSREAIKIRVLPESGELVPGLENIVYLLTAYPDGRPAKCRIDANGEQIGTDASGLATIKVVPTEKGYSLAVKARDQQGNTGTFRDELTASKHKEGLLLRTDKAVYSGGETVNISILSKISKETLFVDVVKGNQTVLTKSLDASGGRGSLVLDLPPNVFGTLKINAYRIAADGNTIGDTRVVYVGRPGQLQIATMLDKAYYKPGDAAKVSFKVTDRHGRPTPAALGISAVDEAVSFLSENRPGLLEQFFMIDRELLRPEYQIKFFASPERLLGGKSEDQVLALAIFSVAGRERGEAFSLDQLSGNYLSEDLLEDLRDGMENDNYKDVMDDPQFERAASILKGKGDFALRATTYYTKKAEAEAYRKWYFDKLKAVGIVVLVSLFALIPIGAFLYSVINLFRTRKFQELDPVQAAVARAANGLVNSCGLAILFPIITYPAGGLLLDISNIPWRYHYTVMWGVFAVNVLFVAAIIVYQVRLSTRLSRSHETVFLGEGMRAVPMLFGLQYLVSRIIIICAVCDIVDEVLAIFFGLGSLVASLIILAIASRISKKAAWRHNVELFRPGVIYEVIATVGIIVILAGMLMPALCRSREEARKASFKNSLKNLQLGLAMFDQDNPRKPGDKSTASAPRVRKYFPETLLWQPELITDERGQATLTVPLADSITTWRMNVDSVSSNGMLGSNSSGIRVFQDFFCDVDLPVALTQNDEVSIPVACYNYLKEGQTVELSLKTGNWCRVEGSPVKVLKLGPSEVRSAYFRVKALGVGTHEITVVARGAKMSDAVRREISVRPDGTEVQYLKTGTLTRAENHSFIIPPEAIANSQSLLLKVYPTTFSEVVEGLDNIFRKPFGCFEQTSSCTYPNVLVLHYMKETGQITPEIEIKARKYVNTGYQRLLTFEVSGGGFDWFGHSPANLVLSAYGVMEFSDMAKVHDVDPAIVERTSKWLLSKQGKDGSWSGRGASMIRGGSKRSEAPALRTTAYIAWALAEAGHRGREVDAALSYIRQRIDTIEDNYTIALAANAFLARDPQSSTGRELLARLRNSLSSEGEGAFLSSTGSGVTYSRGPCLDIETTALAALAMLKSNQYPELTKKVLTWISKQKDSYGTWHSTQATILSMKTLLSGTGRQLGGKTVSEIEVALNGRSCGKINIVPETGDLLHMLSLTGSVRPGENDIRILRKGSEELPYQLVGTFWVPWKDTVVEPRKELEITVDYDRTRLGVSDVLTSVVEVRTNTKSPIRMAIIDLGIPPGFTVETSDFQRMVELNTLAKYEVTGNQCILYVRNIRPEIPLRFNYKLRAKYPIRAKVPPSRVYEYYNPQNEATTKAVEIVVDSA